MTSDNLEGADMVDRILKGADMIDYAREGLDLQILYMPQICNSFWGRDPTTRSTTYLVAGPDELQWSIFQTMTNLHIFKCCQKSKVDAEAEKTA